VTNEPSDAECDAIYCAMQESPSGPRYTKPIDLYHALIRAAFAAGAASVPREKLREQLEQAYRNGAAGRKCYCGALILGKGGQTGHHCGDCNAAIGSM
jgi:hypothetical protein